MAKKPTFKVTGADYEIAKMQLARLRMIAEERLLSFEEAKIYDILVRNLKVSKNDPEEVVAVQTDKEKLLLSTQDAELVEIALGANAEAVLSSPKEEKNDE